MKLRKYKNKGQQRMLEIVVSMIFIALLLLLLQFSIYSYYNHKIHLLTQETSYERAIKVYKAISGAQIFSRSSLETGYLDESKLSAIINMSKDQDKVCDYISQFFGSHTYVMIQNLEKDTNIQCTPQKSTGCGEWIFCEKNKKWVRTYYDMYITLYNPLDEQTYIGYVRIGV